MDIKKVSLADQLSSTKRKLFSNFSLGLVASIIVLSVVLFNVSYETPFFNPVFQGLNSLGSHNTSSSSSILSWPFSFSTTSTSNNSSEKLPHSLVLNQTTQGNLSLNVKDRNFTDSDGKDVILENTHVGKFIDSITNGSQINKNETFVSVSDKGMVLGQLGKSHLSKTVKNGTFEGGMVKSEATVNSNLSSNGWRDQVPETGKIGNITYDGKNVESAKGNNSKNESIKTNLGEDFHMESNLSSNGESIRVSEDSKISNVTYKGENVKTEEVLNGSVYSECDIYNGRWVRDDTKPYYPHGSCPYIDRDFDCHLNGRPDDGYVKWKWQPYGCNIPSLNATDFLERLRGKSVVFVGDSLNRNMWESLVCILRQSIPDKKRVYEISGRTEFKKKGFYAFRFEDYNCSVDFVGSPFLVKEFWHNTQNGSYETLRLDLMDQSTSLYRDADVLIFNTGHWWTHEKTSKGENYYQEGNYVHPRLKVLEAYKRALATWARWVEKNTDPSKTQVIFRGYSVTHFRGGPWNSGGQCHKETEPISNDAYLIKYPSKMKALEHVLKDMKTPVIYLNISRITDYRKDAHPSIYRKDYKPAEMVPKDDHVEDCSHWCLPGVPDTWNELLYASLLKSQRGSWRN